MSRIKSIITHAITKFGMMVAALQEFTEWTTKSCLGLERISKCFDACVTILRDPQEDYIKLFWILLPDAVKPQPLAESTMMTLEVLNVLSLSVIGLPHAHHPLLIEV